MSSVSYCRHHQFGHCKYGGHCRYEHTLETCDNFPCVDKTCDKRHPKICRYFFFSGDCKFNESCSFLHKHEHEDKDDNLKKEIEQLTKDIEVLQGEVDKLKKIFYTFSNVKKPSIEQNSDETDYSVNSKDDSNFSLNQMKTTQSLFIQRIFLSLMAALTKQFILRISLPHTTLSNHFNVTLVTKFSKPIMSSKNTMRWNFVVMIVVFAIQLN